MVNRNSPLPELQRQADQIAATLKRIDRGEIKGEKIDKARAAGVINAAVVMDDGYLTIKISFDVIKATSEAALAALIVKYMRGEEATTH